MKTWIMLLIGFLVGVFGVAMFRQQPDDKYVVAAQEWAKKGVDEISTLPADEQLKAAEAYYGKAVVLFMAALAHRTQSGTGNLGDPIVKEINPQEAILPKEEAQLKTITQSTEVMSDEDVAIKKSPNHVDVYRRAPIARKMSPIIRKINGSYEGVLKHETNKYKDRIDRVVMNFNFSVGANQHLEGEVQILIYDPEGKLYSNKRASGGNLSLKLVPGKKDEVYVEPAPGDVIHLLVRNSNKFTGRYYNENGKQLGRIELWRK